MARSHGRIYTTIWSDADFVALTPDEQRLFLYIVTQPDLDHSGIIALRPKRWTRGSRHLTLDDITRALAGLEAARFVIIDEDAEELLVRSFMRWDGVWKQPNIAKAAAGSIQATTSPVIRDALRRELMRIDIGSANAEVRNLHATLLAALADGSPDPPDDPAPNPSANPSENPSGNPTRRGTGKVIGSRTGNPLPLPLSPSPSAAPASSGRTRAAGKPQRGTRIPQPWTVTPGMVAWVRENCPDVDGRVENEKFENYWLAKSGRDAAKVDWERTWRNWMLEAQQRAARSPRLAAAAPRQSAAEARIAEINRLRAGASQPTTPASGHLAPVIQGSVVHDR